MNDVNPINTAKKTGQFRLNSEYIKEWKVDIRTDRDQNVKMHPSLSHVYRDDANTLLKLATRMGKNSSITELRTDIDSLDTIVREQVPEKLYLLIFN
jgi:hypothetical protein